MLQHYMESQIVQLGLWGNVVEKNMRVKGTDFENLGFSFELPRWVTVLKKPISL